MTLSLDTAYRSFGGEVEASSTPTICRLPDSRRHQLWAIAPKRAFASGPDLSAKAMVTKIKALTKDWSYDVVSIGYPGPVINNRPLSEPHNLGLGWAGFNFEKAFGRPSRVVNDALMQAIGSYQGGRMLFLGLGTGLGSAMIVDGILEP